MPPRITKPIRPGTVIRFEGEALPQIPPSVAETVAIPLVHDWGPTNVPVLVTSFPQFEAIFGSSPTSGRTAVLGAFAGQALPGQGGAGAVYAYRMTAGALPAKATVGRAGADGQLRRHARQPGARDCRGRPGATRSSSSSG